jgi:hypothetical protein
MSLCYTPFPRQHVQLSSRLKLLRRAAVQVLLSVPLIFNKGPLCRTPLDANVHNFALNHRKVMSGVECKGGQMVGCLANYREACAQCRGASNDYTVCILPAPFSPPSMPQNTALM